MIGWLKSKSIKKTQSNIDVILNNLVMVCGKLDREIVETGGGVRSGPNYELLMSQRRELVTQISIGFLTPADVREYVEPFLAMEIMERALVLDIIVHEDRLYTRLDQLIGLNHKLDSPCFGKLDVRRAATLLAAASKGGTFTGKVSAGPFAGSFAYQGSRASRWNDYVGSRVPELMAQGMSAPEAMKQAASEYRERG